MKYWIFYTIITSLMLFTGIIMPVYGFLTDHVEYLFGIILCWIPFEIGQILTQVFYPDKYDSESIW